MFKGKVILITGGSSGIGKETALLFAEKGASVALVYRKNKQGAEEVVSEIKKMGMNGVAFQADLTKDSAAKKVVDKTIKVFGKIDILVNNAGGYIHGDEWDGKDSIWMQSIQKNLISAMSMSKYATKVFEKQKSGGIVNVASRQAMSGRADAVSYGVAKAGLVNLTQSYAELLASFGGRANAVSPSATRAGYWLSAPKEELEERIARRPNKRLIEPREIAEKIVFLASDEVKDINGQNFVIQ